MIETWNITIPQLTGGEPRRAYAYIPDSWQDDPDLRYPVLYMFDGHNVFFDEHATYGKSWGMGDYLDATETQIIVAAVECNHSPDHGRLSEYAPFSFTTPEFGRIRGRGKTTMDWLVKEFKPEVGGRFPTLPGREHTFIAGSSMGGLMSLYAVLKYNRFFSRAAALSPSLWWAQEPFDKLVGSARLRPGTVVYMDYGSEELDNHPGMLRRFGQVTEALLERGAALTSRIVPGGSHCEASWERQIPFFMNTLLYEPD